MCPWGFEFLFSIFLLNTISLSSLWRQSSAWSEEEREKNEPLMRRSHNSSDSLNKKVRPFARCKRTSLSIVDLSVINQTLLHKFSTTRSQTKGTLSVKFEGKFELFALSAENVDDQIIAGLSHRGIYFVMFRHCTGWLSGRSWSQFSRERCCTSNTLPALGEALVSNYSTLGGLIHRVEFLFLSVQE